MALPHDRFEGVRMLGIVGSRKMPVIAVILAMMLALGLCSCGSSAKSEYAVTSSHVSSESSAADEVVTHRTDEAGEDFGNLADFEAILLNGGELTQADLQGKDLTVVNFWSTTCGPCVREMPELAALESSLPDNVQLVTLCLDGSSYSATASEILEESGYEGDTIIAWDGSLDEVVGNIRYMPTTILYDGSGNAVGSAIIGSPKNLEDTYLMSINSALDALGKAEISLG